MDTVTGATGPVSAEEHHSSCDQDISFFLYRCFHAYYMYISDFTVNARMHTMAGEKLYFHYWRESTTATSSAFFTTSSIFGFVNNIIITAGKARILARI